MATRIFGSLNYGINGNKDFFSKFEYHDKWQPGFLLEIWLSREMATRISSGNLNIGRNGNQDFWKFKYHKKWQPVFLKIWISREIGNQDFWKFQYQEKWHPEFLLEIWISGEMFTKISSRNFKIGGNVEPGRKYFISKIDIPRMAMINLLWWYWWGGKSRDYEYWIS